MSAFPLPTAPQTFPNRVLAPAAAVAPTKRVVVIGGGISGLTTAWRLRRARPDLDVVLLERGPSVGGVAQTLEVDGYSVDLGPGTCAPGSERLAALVDDLGLSDQKVEASALAKRRYVFSQGRLHPVPTGLKAWLQSPLVDWSTRLRVFLEPFSRRAPKGDDESVFSFAARRFGDGVASTLIEPLVSGIIAGSAQAVSIQALAPRLYKLDREHRSLVWALATRRNQSPPAKRPWRLSGGIGQITQTLAQTLALNGVIRLNAEVVKLAPGKTRRWAITWRKPPHDALPPAITCEEADVVVMASPAHVSARLLEGLDDDLSRALGEIPYAGVFVTALGFRASEVPEPLDGFGFLARRSEPVRSLGCLWTSSMFPNTAPPGHVLLRVISGGSQDPDFLDLCDADALSVVRHDLQVSLGVKAQPSMVFQRRIRQAIPQYTLGHCARLARIQSLLSHHPGLLLTSSAYQGISLDDCVRQAETSAALAASCC